MSISGLPGLPARRSRAAGAVACALVVSGAAVVPVVAAARAAWATRVAYATVPGKPGTPQPPTPLFTEDFSHQDATGAGIILTNYTGAPGTTYVPGISGASSETYTGDPNWATGTLCDGWILNASTPVPSSGCNVAQWWTGLKQLTQALGTFQGMTASAAAANQALSEYTNGNPGPGIEFQTNHPIPAVAGHFYQVTAVFGAANCTSTHPNLTFSLIVNGTVTPVGSGLDPCASSGTNNVQVASLKSSALQVTGASPTLGLQLYNANGSGGGNDAAFDLPQIMDVTPQLDKSFSPGTIAAGGASALTFTVTNTDELAAKNGWSFTDDLPVGVTATGVNSTTCPSGAVTAGAGAGTLLVSGNLNQGEASCSVTVRVTAPAAGAYTDGPGNFPAGTAGLNGLNPPADATLTVTPPASLVIAKQSSATALPTAGARVTYKFVVTNRGSVPLTGVLVSDMQEPPASPGNMSAVTCATTTLAPGDSTTCTGTYTVTQADVDHGSLQDSATASGTPPSGPTVTAPPSVLVIGPPAPGISVDKSTTTTKATAVGQHVPYTFTVANTGNVPLTGVLVTDTVAPPASPGNMSPVTCPQPDLSAGASEECTGTYTVTQADLDNGSVDDTATASGTPPSGPAVTSPPSPLSVPAQPPAALSVQKATAATAVTGTGQQVPYTFKVTNTSPVTVSSITVTDTVAPPSLPGNLSAVSCPGTSLAAGASVTCTATYQVTQADVNQGQVTDTAHADGTDPSGNPVHSGLSSVTLTVPAATLSVVKAATVASVSGTGQQVPYTFLVTNTGNQLLTSVSVTDTQVAPASPGNMSPVTCPQPTLAAGAAETCTGTYTVTQADLGNGSVNDYAVADGTPPSGPAVASPQSSASVPVQMTPLTMVKSSPDDTYDHIGQQVSYQFTVTNHSAVTYTSILVHDTQQPPASQGGLSAISCPQPDLAAGTSETCTATYTVTAADLDHGTLADTATATGTDPAGHTVTTPSSSVILPATQSPAVTVVKSSTTASVTRAGQQVPYTFAVTNAGNVTLTGVTVTDTVAAPSDPAGLTPVTCPDNTLAAGASETCTAAYTVTQADVDHGSVQDSATGTGIPPSGPPVTSSSPPLVIPAPPAPAVTVVKSAAPAQVHKAGDVISYQFLVTNAGNVTLTTVKVTDTPAAPAGALDGPVTCLGTTLAPGASTTCTGAYTVTQADIDHGSVGDSATASGTPPSGPAVASPPSAASVPAPGGPAVTVVKSTASASATHAGQQVPYSFLVTNTGNVTLHGVLVTDTVATPSDPAGLSPVTCPDTTLAPGASTTCTAAYTVTQADVDNGSVDDSASASGTPPSGPAVTSPPSAASVPAPAGPAIAIVKSATPGQVHAADDVISYRFTVTNTGNVTLTSVAVTDAQAAPAEALDGPVSCPDTTLAPRASTTCTGAYTVTQADIDHGSVDDAATASGTPPAGPAVTSPPAAVLVPAAAAPAIAIVKYAAPAQVHDAGDVISYQFLVTNAGNVTLHGVTVTDAQVPPAGALDGPVTCPESTLAPGASVTCTAAYTVTRADVDHGSVSDSATASGTPPSGPAVTSPPSDASVPAPAGPAIAIVKSAPSAQVHAAGDLISYQFTVTNAGNVTLHGVTVTDAQAAPAGALDGPATCPDTTLAPGASVTCTGTYTVTQADVDNGSVDDSATASGTPPSGPAVASPPSAVSIPVAAAPAIAIVKSATPAQVHAAGDMVTYRFTVTNTGNDTLTGVSVADVQAAPAGALDGPVTCPDSTLAPGASTTCTGTYTVTQADIDNGSVDDTATASGTPPSGPAVTSPAAAVLVPAAAAPAIAVVKSATPAQVHAAGELISYQFLVTNAGNVTLTAVAVADVQAAPAGALDGPATCPDSTLAPGVSVTCTGTYTVTQADVDHGSVDDSATATGTPPSGPAVTSPPSAASVPAPAGPAVSVVKSALSPQVHAAGDVISYQFTVTNTGNVTLTSVAVTDAQGAPAGALGGPVTCPDTTLAPGASLTCTGTYTVTQADIDHGSVDDTATATGTPPSGPAVTSPPSAVSVPVPSGPAISIVKSATPGQVHDAGDVISYQFTVTNAGNDTLTGVNVTDAQAAPAGPLDGPVTCPDSTLAPGASTTCAAAYTVTQADIDHGSVDDTATATGTPPSGPTVTSPPAAVTVPAPPAPAIAIVKSATPAQVHAAGDVISYQFLVTNTGNVTLASVTVTDAQAAPAGGLDGPVSCPEPALAPGASMTCTAAYTVTQADADHGSVSDSATATGTPPSGPAVTSPPSDASVPVAPAPAIAIVKSAPSAQVHAAGDVISYQFTVTNTGNVTLAGVTVADAQAAPAGALDGPVTCPEPALAPGASLTCTGTYTVTQADIDNGSVDDTATATGTPPSGPAVTSPPSAVSVPVAPAPAIAIVKSATPAQVHAAGDLISYTFAVTNTGNVTLTSVTVADAQAAPAGALDRPVYCPEPALAPGASVTCTGTYTVTQADVDNGSVDDSATASGTPPSGPAVTSPPSAASVPVNQSPAITVDKSTTTTTVTHAGQQVPYTFLVTNTGNVTLTGVAVTDTVAPPSDPASLSPVTCPESTLAPGAQVTCTATYTLAQADVDHGSVSDSATATGTPPARPPVTSPPSAASVPAPPAPALSVVKSAPSAQVAVAGDVIGYEFLVTNTGNVTLTGVTVTDTGTAPAGSLDGPVTCPVTTLAPGAQVTCTGSYTLTQADVDNGSVTDTATASATPPSGPAVTSPPSAVLVPVPSGPAISIVKSATPAQVRAPGEVVTYRFTVTNTGNDTLHNVAVSDTQAAPAGSLDGPVSCPATTLAPGAQVTCTATYTVTQADIDNGQVDDTATATGTPPSGPPATSPRVHVQVLAPQAPAITVVKKAATAEVTRAGQQVRYTFLVTDIGNVTLHDVTVSDAVEPPSDPAGLSPVTCPDATLTPGASETCTATYTVTQADVDHDGPLRDYATVTGRPPATAGDPHPGPLPPSPRSRALVPVAQEPGIAVVKSASPAQVPGAGSLIRYQFLVTNTGNVTLTRVTDSDPDLARAGIASRCPDSRLAPGKSETCTAVRPYVVTQDDAARGTVANTVTATADTPSGAVIRSRPSTVTVRVSAAAIVIPTGEGATAAPAASPAQAAAGTAALAAGTLLLLAGRRRRRRNT